MFMLRQIRKSRGLTMAELGKMVGKTESAIGLYEKERRQPDFETLLKLGEALNCSIDSILGNNYALTNEEEQLLYIFRQFQSERRYAAIQILSSLLQTEKNNADTDSVSA